MPIRKSEAVWEGDLRQGHGTMKLGSGAFEGAYSFSSRFEEGKGTNPEELLGAAHAGCFSMAFANRLAKAGFKPERVKTIAKVKLEPGDAGFHITQIALDCEARVTGISLGAFQAEAETAKKGCPISQALAAVEIVLTARLV
jgi:lipoyl-dependent peroxiredoxin